jgi:hypothetical protein
MPVQAESQNCIFISSERFDIAQALGVIRSPSSATVLVRIQAASYIQIERWLSDVRTVHFIAAIAIAIFSSRSMRPPISSMTLPHGIAVNICYLFRVHKVAQSSYTNWSLRKPWQYISSLGQFAFNACYLAGFAFHSREQ